LLPSSKPAILRVFYSGTDIYICDENEKRLPKVSLKAFDGAVGEYFAAPNRQPQ
jgi:hypothetical protein